MDKYIEVKTKLQDIVVAGKINDISNVDVLAQLLKIINEGLVSPSCISDDLGFLIPAVFNFVFSNEQKIKDTAIPLFGCLQTSLSDNLQQKQMKWWSDFKVVIEKCFSEKVLSLMKNGTDEWSVVWCILARMLGEEMNASLGSANALLRVVERALKSKSPDQYKERQAAFECWKTLIDGFALTKGTLSKRRLDVLLIPLKAPNHSAKSVCEAKLQTWMYLITKMGLQNESWLEIFIPPLMDFLYTGNRLTPPAHQIISPNRCAGEFITLVKNSVIFKHQSQLLVKMSAKCIQSIKDDSSQLYHAVWCNILDGLKKLYEGNSGDTTIFDNSIGELVGVLKELLLGFPKNEFARFLHSCTQGKNKVNQLKNYYNEIVDIILNYDIMLKLDTEIYGVVRSILDLYQPKERTPKIFNYIINKTGEIAKTNDLSKPDVLNIIGDIWAAVCNCLIESAPWVFSNDDYTLLLDMLIFPTTYLLTKNGWSNGKILVNWKDLFATSSKVVDVNKQSSLISNEVIVKLAAGSFVHWSSILDIINYIVELSDSCNAVPFFSEIINELLKPGSELNNINFVSAVCDSMLKYSKKNPNFLSEIVELVNKFVNIKNDSTKSSVSKIILKLKNSLSSMNNTTPKKNSKFLLRLARAKELEYRRQSTSPGSSPQSMFDLKNSVDKKFVSPSIKTPVKSVEDDSQEFVMVPPKPRTTPLTEHQKEYLSSRRCDIPALYHELSQDSQTLFDRIEIKVTKSLPRDLSKEEESIDCQLDKTKIVDKSIKICISDNKSNEQSSISVKNEKTDSENSSFAFGSKLNMKEIVKNDLTEKIGEKCDSDDHITCSEKSGDKTENDIQSNKGKSKKKYIKRKSLPENNEAVRKSTRKKVTKISPRKLGLIKKQRKSVTKAEEISEVNDKADTDVSENNERTCDISTKSNEMKTTFKKDSIEGTSITEISDKNLHEHSSNNCEIVTKDRKPNSGDCSKLSNINTGTKVTLDDDLDCTLLKLTSSPHTDGMDPIVGKNRARAHEKIDDRSLKDEFTDLQTEKLVDSPKPKALRINDYNKQDSVVSNNLSGTKALSTPVRRLRSNLRTQKSPCVCCDSSHKKKSTSDVKKSQGKSHDSKHASRSLFEPNHSENGIESLTNRIRECQDVVEISTLVEKKTKMGSEGHVNPMNNEDIKLNTCSKHESVQLSNELTESVVNPGSLKNVPSDQPLVTACVSPKRKRKHSVEKVLTELTVNNEIDNNCAQYNDIKNNKTISKCVEEKSSVSDLTCFKDDVNIDTTKIVAVMQLQDATDDVHLQRRTSPGLPEETFANHEELKSEQKCNGNSKLDPVKCSSEFTNGNVSSVNSTSNSQCSTDLLPNKVVHEKTPLKNQKTSFEQSEGLQEKLKQSVKIITDTSENKCLADQLVTTYSSPVKRLSPNKNIEHTPPKVTKFNDDISQLKNDVDNEDVKRDYPDPFINNMEDFGCSDGDINNCERFTENNGHNQCLTPVKVVKTSEEVGDSETVILTKVHESKQHTSEHSESVDDALPCKRESIDQKKTFPVNCLDNWVIRSHKKKLNMPNEVKDSGGISLQKKLNFSSDTVSDSEEIIYSSQETNHSLFSITDFVSNHEIVVDNTDDELDYELAASEKLSGMKIGVSNSKFDDSLTTDCVEEKIEHLKDNSVRNYCNNTESKLYAKEKKNMVELESEFVSVNERTTDKSVDMCNNSISGKLNTSQLSKSLSNEDSVKPKSCDVKADLVKINDDCEIDEKLHVCRRLVDDLVNTDFEDNNSKHTCKNSKTDDCSEVKKESIADESNGEECIQECILANKENLIDRDSIETNKTQFNEIDINKDTDTPQENQKSTFETFLNKEKKFPIKQPDNVKQRSPENSQVTSPSGVNGRCKQQLFTNNSPEKPITDNLNNSPQSARGRTAHLMELVCGGDNTPRPPRPYTPRRIQPVKLANFTPVATNEASGEKWICKTYSPHAKPSPSILKARLVQDDTSPPPSKKKRVNFHDPPVSRSLLFVPKEFGRGTVLECSKKSGSGDTSTEIDNWTKYQPQIEPKASTTKIIWPSLVDCRHSVTPVIKLVCKDSFHNLEKQLLSMDITDIGKLSSMTEDAVEKLPIKPPKILRLRNALRVYENLMPDLKEQGDGDCNKDVPRLTEVKDQFTDDVILSNVQPCPEISSSVVTECGSGSEVVTPKSLKEIICDKPLTELCDLLHENTLLNLTKHQLQQNNFKLFYDLLNSVEFDTAFNSDHFLETQISKTDEDFKRKFVVSAVNKNASILKTLMESLNKETKVAAYTEDLIQQPELLNSIVDNPVVIKKLTLSERFINTFYQNICKESKVTTVASSFNNDSDMLTDTLRMTDCDSVAESVVTIVNENVELMKNIVDKSDLKTCATLMKFLAEKMYKSISD